MIHRKRYAAYAGSGAAGGYDADVLAWQAAAISAGATPSVNQLLYNQALVTQLKNTGVWGLLDRLWIFAMETQAEALIDLVAQATATNHSTTFTAFQGFVSNGTTQYIDSGFNPATAGGKYTQNSASYGVWAYSDPGGAAGALMGNDNDDGADVNFLAAGAIDGGINQNASLPTWTPSSRLGLTSFDRTGATAMAGYSNGAVGASGTRASISPPSRNFTICGATGSGGPTNFTTAKISAAFIGGSLGEAAIYAALRSYMTAVGVP